jgi:hypothetical protein
MGQARQTFERRQLGLALRRLREGAGKPQQAAADALNKVRSRVVALEDGTATATQEDLHTLLDCYDVTGAERETLLALAAHARKRTKRRTHVDVLPDAYRRFADLEASAVEIDCHETGVIPGLLQSPAYVRALIAECEGAWWEPGDVEAEDRVAFRLDRQAAVFGSGRSAKRLRFVVTEDTLRADMGTPDVMREQLAHLLALVDGHRALSVRVMAGNTYGNPVRGRSLLVFGFGERGAPIGYSETVLGPSAYYDDVKDTSAMIRAFHRGWERALSPAGSRGLIERVLEET